MRSPRKFLGVVPVESRARRRALVVAYYLFYVPVFAGVLLWCHTLLGQFMAMYVAVILLASALGGIGGNATSPVRPFAEYLYKVRGRARAEGRRPQSRIVVDEQDRAARDRAHYLAYTVILWVLLLGGGFVPSEWGHLRVEQRPEVVLALSSALFIVYFSLPQTILLWTEPDVEGEFAEAEGAAWNSVR